MRELLLMFLLLPLSIAAQSYWVNREGGSGNDEILDMAADSAGNIYATGYFTGLAAFGSITLNSAGNDDIFLAKYDPSGNLIWIVSAGGANGDKGTAIAVTPGGEVFLTGFFTGQATFGTTSISGNSVAPDVFVARYSSAGQLIWVSQGGGAGIDLPNGIAVDTAGNSVVTGQAIGNWQFGSYSFTSANNPQTGNPGYDIFIVRFDATGNVAWARQGSGKYTDRGMSIAMDAHSDAYVVLQFTDTVTFNAVYPNSIYNVIGLLKIDSAGTEKWMKRIGGGAMQVGYNVLAGPQGEIYLTGDFRGNLYFFGHNYVQAPTGNSNYFLAKFDTSGAFHWSTGAGSASEVSSRSIALDQAGNVFLTGHFACTMDDFAAPFGPGAFNSVGYSDIWAAKYEPSGNFSWARQAGGKKNDFSYSVVVGNSQRPLIGGSFLKGLMFPSTGVVPGSDGLFPYNYNIQSYCQDQNYNQYSKVISRGLADVVLGDIFDLSRQPLDYHVRQGNSCTRNSLAGCIGASQASIADLQCGSGLSNTQCAGDSVAFCDQGVIFASTFTSFLSPCDSVGPDFRYYWSTGDTAQRALVVNQSGLFNLTATTADGCYSYSDTIDVFVSASPDVGVSETMDSLFTDVHGNQVLTLCQPDTVVLNGHHAQGLTYSWTTNSGAVQDSILQVTQAGTYGFSATTQYGCSDGVNITIYYDSVAPVLPVFVPAISFDHPSLSNDTITLCANESFCIWIHDTVSMTSFSGHDSLSYTVSNTSSSGSFYPYGNLFNQPCSMQPKALSTGWVHVTGTVTRIVSNSCGSDSLTLPIHDSVFVNVLPAPVAIVQIYGDSLLCPGDTAVMQVTGNGVFTWSQATGLSIVHDSLAWTFTEGSYQVLTTVTDSAGCKDGASDTFLVKKKEALLITNKDPFPLICPGDSVQLIAEPGVSFDWYGPYGYMGTTSINTFYVHNSGFYYVIQTDSSGCTIVSNMVEIRQYATPDLLVLPSPAICPGDSVTLQLIYSPGSTISWNSPFTGSDSMQVVHQPGVYSADVHSCGIQTTVSATITMSNPSATITASGPLQFCQGDSVVLTGNPGMISYTWNPGGSFNPSLTVSGPGTYSLTTINADGCEAVSAPVTVVVDTFAAPGVNDTTICSGSQVNLQASGAGTIHWFLSPNDTASFFTGSVLPTTPLFNDTTFWVAAEGNCMSSKVPVTVKMDTSSLAPSITGSALTCQSGNIILNGPLYPGAVYSWSGPAGYSSSQQSDTLNNVGLNASGIYSLIIQHNGCTSDTGFFQVQVEPVPAPLQVTGTDSVCAGDSIHLTANVLTGINYQWTGPGSFNANGNLLVIPAAAISDSGIYGVSYSTPGCQSDTTWMHVTVNPLPSAPLIAGDDSLCAGDSLLLTAAGAGTMHWNGPAGFSAVGNSVTTYPASHGVYSVYAVEQGCMGTSSSVLIAVATPPALHPYYSGFPCLDSIVDLHAGFDFNGTFNWSGPGGFASSGHGATLTNLTASDSGWYYVTGTLAGCSIVDSVYLPASTPAPAANISDSIMICEGDTLVIIPGNGQTVNTWVTNWDVLTHAGPLVYPNITLNDSGYYQVTAIGTGCPGSSESIHVTVKEKPKALFPQSNPVCKGDTLWLTAQLYGATIYFWTGPAGFSASANQVFVYPADTIHSGTYQLTASKAGCTSGPDFTTATVHPEPIVSLGQDTIICTGDQAQLGATGPFASWSWNTGATTPIITVSDSGEYVLTVTSGAGCHGSDTVNVKQVDCRTLSVPNIFSPNGDGVNDLFVIDEEGFTFEQCTIFNRWGGEIFKWGAADQGWNGVNHFTMQQSSPGTYFYVARLKDHQGKSVEAKGFVTLVK